MTTSPKTEMDTQNDGLEKVDSFEKMVIFGIYARFLRCKPDEGWGIESYLKLQIQHKVTKDERCRNDVQLVRFEGRIDWLMKL